MFKCPNCGAPVTGNACIYCGQDFSARPAETARGETPAPSGKNPGEGTRERGENNGPAPRQKRNALDMILIVLGSLWLLMIFAVQAELEYWHSLIEIMAVLLTACPGIVLLLIGLRRKKPKRMKK